jgi:uncharacterized protein (DUF1330 family)
MSSIVPNDETLRTLASNPDEGAFVMLNLLKFKGKEGTRAYDRYMEDVSKILETRGAHVTYTGKMFELLVGNETWDAIILVEYPSRRVFLEMVNSPEYQKAHVSREQGLERAVLYVTSPIGEVEKFSE